jgi:hypothetical protein
VQAASSAITAAGLTPIDLTDRCSNGIGAVASQDPAGGSYVRAGTWVYFKAPCLLPPR